MSLNCWVLLMASSSVWGKVAATSLARRETSDLRNQLRHCWGVASALQRLRRPMPFMDVVGNMCGGGLFEV
jgi:hypothetical protein